MENELVHHHDFHSIQFQNFNVKERNVIYALCYKVMNQGTDLLEFSVKEIEQLANYKARTKGDNVYKLMEEVYDRVKNASIKIKKENGIKAFVLFTKFETFEDKGIIQIKVNEEYRYLLNELAAPFTIQNIIEYSQLSSGYSQLAYSFLKKWEGIKKIKISIIEFREILGVPESYDSSDFNKRVLSYVEKELPNYFFNLKIEKIKTGRKVTHLNFNWRNKPTISNQEIVEITISKKLQDAFDKAFKNRFIKDFLTEDNKYKLIDSFQEEDLIRGLKYAKDNINCTFKTFSYLENSIKKGLEKPIIKTIVPEEENIVLGEQLIIKTKVTQEQFDILLEKELKKIHKDNLKRNPYFKDHTIRRLEKEFEIIEEDEENKGQFPPKNNLTSDKKNKEVESFSLEDCSFETQELLAKLEEKRLEYEKLEENLDILQKTEETDPQLKIFLDLIEFKIKQTKEEINDKSFWTKRKINLELEELEENLKKFYNLIESCNIENMNEETINSLEKFTKYFEDYFNIKL